MKRTKGVALTISMALIAGLFTACSEKKTEEPAPSGTASDNFNQTGMPIAKEPVTIKVFAGKPPTASDWNEVMLWKEYEKMTNIHIQWDPQIPFQNLAEKLNITLASGDYPDAIYGSQLGPDQLLKYGSEGALLPLEGLIDKYAPNIKKLFDENPDIKRGYTMPDGHIYSFPTVVEPDYWSVRMGARLWFKKEWMDRLNLAEPKTVDDFYNLLKTIKEKDPQGNGQTVPYSTIGIDTLISYLAGAWGLNNHGVSNGEIDLDPQTNKLRYVPADPKYKEVLQFINKLYSEDLISKDVFVNDYAKFVAEGSKGNFFATYTMDPELVLKQKGYVGAPALKGPHGDQMYTGLISPILWHGSLVLTKNIKNPEMLVRWVDYFYSEEGSKLFFMGKEGVTYETKPDGSVDFVDAIKNNPNGLNFDQSVSKYLTWPGGGYAGIVRKKYFRGSEGSAASLAAAEKLKPHFPKEIWSSFSFTADETDTLTTLGNDILTYTGEMRVKFITGKIPFSEWDSYVSELNKMGLKKYMDIYEAAYARYQKK